MVQQRDAHETIILARKSFFRGKKTTVEAGIRSFFLLILDEESSKLRSLLICSIKFVNIKQFYGNFFFISKKFFLELTVVSIMNTQNNH